MDCVPHSPCGVYFFNILFQVVPGKSLMFIFKKLVNQIKIPGTTWNIFPCALHSITILAGKTEKANLFHTVWNGFWRFSYAEKDCHSGSLFIFSYMCAIICLSVIF